MAEKKILIADYEQQSLELFSKLLKAQKYKLITATDGQAAYEKFYSEKPDLVVLEAMLPKLHGFDLTKKIVQESGGAVPVIIVTAIYRGPQFREEAIKNFGAADFFEKPIEPDKFLARVNEFLQDEPDYGEVLPGSDQVLDFLAKALEN
jgi:DNA-binding response OmpR family regulator